MKKRTHRLLAMLLVLMMCLSIVGCGGNNSPGSNDPGQAGSGSGNTGTNAPSTPGGGDTVTPTDVKNTDIYPLNSSKTFTFAVAGDNVNEHDNVLLWKEITGVDINFLTWDSEQMRLSLAAREMPDAIAFTNAVDKATIYEYGQAGMLVNYMDYLEYMPNFQWCIENYPQTLALIQNEDGSVYSLPRIGTTATTHDSIYVRLDMLEEAGWDHLPATTDEFLQCIKDVQAHFGANDPEFVTFNGYNATQMSWNGSSGVIHFFFPNFGELLETGLTVTPDGKEVVLGAATEQYKHMLEFLNEVYESGAFSTDIYTEDGTTSRAVTLANKVAISAFASYMTPANGNTGDMSYMDLLAPLTSQYQTTQHWRAKSSYLWQTNIINANLPEEDIITLVQWFDSHYAPEENPLNKEGTIWGISFWLGELGVDWDLNEANNSYEILPHDGYDSGSAWLSNAGVSAACLGLYDFLYAEMSGSGLQVKATGTINNQWPYREDPPYETTMLTLTQEETEDYNDYWTDISNFIKESSARFITGEEDIETGWNTYINNLNQMGLQEVLDIYNDAYARALAQ